jgi:rhodanese-related sulfurtransferase
MKKILSTVALAAMLIGSLSASDKLVKLSTEEAKKVYDSGKALFIDARGAKLYQKGTIMGAFNMPTKKFKANAGLLPADKKALIISFCNGVKCEKSDVLAGMLIKAGYTNVKVYPGGYPEWKEKKLPLMGLVRECKEAPKGEYKPTTQKVTVMGATVYPGADAGMIDQFWFAPIVTKDLPKGLQLVDVRKAEQFKEGHIKGAINIPFDSEKSTLDISKIPTDKLVVFYCNTGMMSTDAYTSLKKLGYKGTNVMYFDANVECKGSECTVVPNEVL